MKKGKLFLCVVMTLMLCACSSQGDQYSYSYISKGSSSKKSSDKDVLQTESIPLSENSIPEISDIPIQSSKVDYYNYYDPITNRSTTFEDGTHYILDHYGCLNIIDPYSVAYCRKIDKVKGEQMCVALDDYVFYDYSSSSSTIGLKKYDLNTGEVTEVIEAAAGSQSKYDLAFDHVDLSCARYVLSNDNKIYGMVISWELQAYTTPDGKLDVKNISKWNLVRVNDSYDGYTVVKTFDEKYDYYLNAVYDNIAYFSKSEIDRVGDFKFGHFETIRGEELGFYSYDIEKGVEEKVFDTYKDYNYDKSDYKVVEIDGECCYLYENRKDGTTYIRIYTKQLGWKEVFSSKNNTAYGNGVQFENGRIYVMLSTDIDGAFLCYEVTMDSSKYFGICINSYAGNAPFAFYDAETGETKYLAQDGSIRDFE